MPYRLFSLRVSERELLLGRAAAVRRAVDAVSPEQRLQVTVTLTHTLTVRTIVSGHQKQRLQLHVAHRIPPHLHESLHYVTSFRMSRAPHRVAQMRKLILHFRRDLLWRHPRSRVAENM